jgi:2OG-Fe(II) oxygenase superfamily
MAKKKFETPSKTPVNFPSISQPIESPLSSITLLDSQILILPSFLSSETCKSYVSCFSKLPLLPSPPPSRNEATRTNFRLATEDPKFALRLFTESGLEEFTSTWTVQLGKKSLQVKGLHSNIRIYRYDEGAFFGPHYDSSTRDGISGFTSYWTLLVYLTGKEDGVEGGETVFYQSGKSKDTTEIVVKIERGMALLHRHGGSDCLLHEGRLVTKGTKWVLRSDLVFG